ncbi:uncharacterized protein LOC117318339 [Pecten maximus]|uniref:uncharacterized protein LOC117318339 n=1 Tax=Pecten maximus TaxID=6579 RepID=UPI0014583676|nr:uncharacterized protein LOC117318339 [Pecten maximus]
MDNKNKDYHFFATDFILDRVSVSSLDDSKPIGNINTTTYRQFVPSACESQKYKESLKIILGRLLSEYVDGFKWMENVLLKHIPHNFEESMSKKSEVFVLPVLLKNETSYSDCIHILKSYEKDLTSWYIKAGRAAELDRLKVPIGGDQLTRVRLQGAKGLQDGSLTATDRLEHLDPMIVELFHTVMDFLEKLYKRFFNKSSGREKGTLYNLKILIQRSNVNGNVKSRFEAHEDFIMTVGCGYFLSYILHFFQMENLSDEPKHPLLSKNMKMRHKADKEKVLSEILEEVVNGLLILFPEKEPDVLLTVDVLGIKHTVNSSIDGRMLKFHLNINNSMFLFNVTPAQVENGVTIDVPLTTVNLPVTISRSTVAASDELNDYITQLLQWYFVLLTFKDSIKEGDTFRTNITLKFCIPIFFSHSVLSKYLEECIDYILKTEVMLTEKMAVKVRCGSFVNPTGHKGDNKAADLQKENEVKVLKELIRGLGSNKTENSIVAITKAAPVIDDIVGNFQEMLNIPVKKTHHRKRSFNDDVKCVLNTLIPLKVWTPQNGRKLENFRNIKKSPFDIDRGHFVEIVEKKVERLRKGISVPADDNSDNEV